MCLYSINCSEKEFNFILFTRKYYKNNPTMIFLFKSQAMKFSIALQLHKQ